MAVIDVLFANDPHKLFHRVLVAIGSMLAVFFQLFLFIDSTDQPPTLQIHLETRTNFPGNAIYTA